MSDTYRILGKYYDFFMQDVNYPALAKGYQNTLERFGAHPSLVLDLGCGSGKLTVALSKRGYDMTGVDLSAQMLAKASDFARAEGENILFLEQDMTSFELYGTVGAIISSFDCMNYLLTEDALGSTFDRVQNYLDDDGLFLFDVNTPYKFSHLYGHETYVQEGDHVFCVWENNYNEKRRICDFDLTFFCEEEDGRYVRLEEHQREKCWSRRTLEKQLKANHLRLLAVCSDLHGTPAEKTDERHYYICKKEK